MFCFLLLKVNTQASPSVFSDRASHELITVKILEFYMAHFDLLVYKLKKENDISKNNTVSHPVQKKVKYKS
jgi:hypothetical protein